MRRFLDRVARSIITAADVIARLIEDQSSDRRTTKRANTNVISDQPKCDGTDSHSKENPKQSQQASFCTDQSILAVLPGSPRDEGSTEESQPIIKSNIKAGERGVLADENWIPLKESTDSFHSDISLEANCPTGPGLDEIVADERPSQFSDRQSVTRSSPTSKSQLPVDSETSASLVGEDRDLSASGACAQTQHLEFDISLRDLEEKSKSTWQEGFHAYISPVQSQFKHEDLEHHEEVHESTGHGQDSHLFDIGLNDLEIRQQSTWHESQNSIRAEKTTPSLSNRETGLGEIHELKLDSRVESDTQYVSKRSAGIQAEESPLEVTDEYWEVPRSNLRPYGLEELQLRESGALTRSHYYDPEDYIWALDGAGYFDNIWNIEGFFESMVDEIQDRHHDALYWAEESGD